MTTSYHIWSVYFFTQSQFCVRQTPREHYKKYDDFFPKFFINYSLLVLDHIPCSLILSMYEFTEIGMSNLLEMSPGHLETQKGS